MCLDVQYKNRKPPSGTVTVYKAFKVRRLFNNGNIVKNLQFPWYGSTTTPGRWVKADERCTLLPIRSYGSYTSGFHGFASETMAKRAFPARLGYVVLKVKFREIHTVGVQDGLVYVARYMFLPTREYKRALGIK